MTIVGKMAIRSINEMMADSCVFLTGVTGFVGGCLLERICKLEPGPSRIYILVREKHGIDPQSRLQKIFSSPLFSGIPRRQLERIQVLPGDVGSEKVDLGMSEVDVRFLCEECTHVYHVAAFISFAAQLDQAIRINLRGSRAVLGLARRMRRLRAMVHVSTAYINCTRSSEHVEFYERIYPVDVDPVEFLEAVKSLSPRDVEKRYAKSIGLHPNTYTFTKQLTENLLARERDGIPLSIVRPGIILNSWREPFAGWVDNVNSGACGFIAGAGKGIFCTLQARPDAIMDVIPVDLVVSTILAAALKAEQQPEQLHVFHCTSGSVNPTTWGTYCTAVIRATREHPCEDAAWYPRSRLRLNRLRHELVVLVFQLLPTYIVHLTLAAFTNIKLAHNILEIQRRYAKGSRYASYFSMREWLFVRSASDELAANLPEVERDRHPMDPRLIDWEAYFKNCVLGTRVYFHKEPAKTTRKARRQMAILRVIAAVAPALSFTALASCLAFLTGTSWTLAVAIAAFLVLLLVWI